MTTESNKPPRILSIDQCRGYAIFGMILVNYLGQFGSMPWQFKHHHAGLSYADTIAPLFMFVVGMGFRHSLGRRIAADGAWAAYRAAARRYALLILIGIVIYGPVPRQWVYWWDALVDIGFAGLLSLPFIARGAGLRIAVGVAYAVLFQVLFLKTGYGEWTMSRSIDGGPLGPLSWATILLFGTLAYDVVAARDVKRIIVTCIAWGVLLCAAGWLLRMEWPGLKPEWPFSQRAMTMPYTLFTAGLCFWTYLAFYVVCDAIHMQSRLFATLSANALVIYIVSEGLVKICGPNVLPIHDNAAYALAGFCGVLGLCYALAWTLKRKGIVVKL